MRENGGDTGKNTMNTGVTSTENQSNPNFIKITSSFSRLQFLFYRNVGERSYDGSCVASVTSVLDNRSTRWASFGAYLAR